MDVLKFMKQNNKESRHTDLIRESSKTQGILQSSDQSSDQPKPSDQSSDQPKPSDQPKSDKIYQSPSLVKVILKALDPYLIGTQISNHTFEKRVLEIASAVDDFPKSIFQKSMSTKKIQNAFQESLHNRNHLSLLYYLNEYYKRSFILIVGDKYWKTLWKKNEYPEETIRLINGSWSLQDEDISNKKEVSMLDLDDLLLIQDIKGIPYQTSYKPIGNYKIETLKALCSDKNISLTIKDTGKKKRKEQLYHELLLEELSQSPSQQ